MFSNHYHFRIARRTNKGNRLVTLGLVGFVLILFVFASYSYLQASSIKSNSSEYTVRVTHQDTDNFPFIKAYLSITDAEGNPIPDNLPINLFIYEDGKPVSQQTLSEGWTVSSVLVLDVSKSMSDDNKIQKAREAAINYINSAPAPYKMAVVAFSNEARVIGKFTDSRKALCAEISKLGTGGGTALQDALGRALDLLNNQTGRKAITLLTDGYENSSKKYPAEIGQAQLIDRAKKEGCSIFTIGLDVEQHDYLRSYEDTGGKYLYSPTKNELNQAFVKSVNLLKQEVVVEYTSLSKELDGSIKNVSFELLIGDVNVISQDPITIFGVIPHVPGDPIPWVIGITALLAIPATFSYGFHFLQVYRFRSSRIKRLMPGSPCIGKRDLNEGSCGRQFVAGDLTIICPSCKHPHGVRSWRMNGCKCMRDGLGKGSYCYQQRIPRRIRYILDDLSNNALDEERGRTWLCFCAGDRSRDRRGY